MSTPSIMMYRAVSVYWISVLLVPSVAQRKAVRLAGGTREDGRLEIFHKGQWQSVCALPFGEREALVACRMLGFNRARALAVSSVKYGEGSGPTMSHIPICEGTETSLKQCQQINASSSVACNHVGVMCNMDVLNITKRMRARLVGGTSTAGRLEIFFNGEWGTVCGLVFGIKEAKTACRMLGLQSNGAMAIPSYEYGQGKGRVLLQSVDCEGTERSLTQCTLGVLYSRFCKHDIDIGVICNITKQMTARLVDGTSEAGRLEINFNGKWGTVCGTGFGKREAKVACRMLGFKSTGAAVLNTDVYGHGEGHVLIESEDCDGTESSLAQCNDVQLYPQACDHDEDVGIVCNITTPMTARLSGGTSKAGRLEISDNGEWTTMCEEGFEQSEVEVACRMLGFNSTGQSAVKFLLFGDGSGFQFSNIKCQGMETSLEQCEFRDLRKNDCLDVGIFCDFRDFRLRLTGPRRTDSNMGRVQVEIGSGLSRMCVNNEKTARVICRQLNLTSDNAALIDGWLFGQDMSPLLEATFACDGSENSLDDCGLINTAKDCYLNYVAVFCSSNKRLLIVSWDERYPFIEGANGSLLCVTPLRYQQVTEYTWEHTAGGRPHREFLIFDNLTREYNGRVVSCYTKCRDSDSDLVFTIHGDLNVLKVYYKPLITITWTDNTGEQQPLSSLSELKPGHNVTLWCKADSNPPPASITWSGRVNSTTGELRILAADHVTHSGVYTCTVVTITVDDDDRLPLTSSYRLNLSVQG